jgi:uncharacterized protein (UPF0332 family)
MNINHENYLKEASDLIETAELLLKNHWYKSVINRSYYSIFNCVEALLLDEGVFIKTHSGLKTKFSELFVKTGKFDIQLAGRYAALFRKRLTVDYDIDADLTYEDAEEALAIAKEFLVFAVAYFNK